MIISQLDEFLNILDLEVCK